MRVSIQDRHALLALRPLEIIAYLRMTGWQQDRVIQNRWALWIKEGDFEIALPLTRDFGDFDLRMSDALRTLEIVENRSQMEILNDLLTSSTDIVRLRISDNESADGTISIEEGTQIIQRVRDLVMAGACAAIEKRSVFQTRKPNQVVEYINKVRLGQTERGSYVVTVLSHVAPILNVRTNNELFGIEQPFERKVITTLAKAIVAAKHAASNAMATGDFQNFQSAVDKGVSANLCDAIYGLAIGGETSREVEVNFSWSRSRPIEDNSIESRIMISPDSMPIFKEASRLFRETVARDDFVLNGPVVKLERGEEEDIGRVTIIGFVDDQPRKVLLELTDSDYHKAIQAHEDGQTIYCVGELVRSGRSFLLKNPRDLSIRTIDS